MRTPLRNSLILMTAASSLATAVYADGHAGEVNLYSSRHYDTDERLYSDFTDLTGITINRIEANADELIARMQAEGANSPADILLTVDTSRLERAKQAERVCVRVRVCVREGDSESVCERGRVNVCV